MAKLYFAGGSGFIGGRSNKAPMSKGYATAYTDTVMTRRRRRCNVGERQPDEEGRLLRSRNSRRTVAAKAVTQAYYESASRIVFRRMLDRPASRRSLRHSDFLTISTASSRAHPGRLHRADDRIQLE